MAQRSAGVRIDLPAPAVRGEEGPRVRAQRVLSDARLRDLLRNGFPARLHWKVEVWSTRGWFDDLKGTVEWDIIVRYEPLERRYEIVHIDATEEQERRIGQANEPVDKNGKLTESVLKPSQWIKLIDRLGQIDNPTVSVKPSKYAIRVPVPRASEPHRGE